MKYISLLLLTLASANAFANSSIDGHWRLDRCKVHQLAAASHFEAHSTEKGIELSQDPVLGQGHLVKLEAGRSFIDDTFAEAELIYTSFKANDDHAGFFYQCQMNGAWAGKNNLALTYNLQAALVGEELEVAVEATEFQDGAPTWSGHNLCTYKKAQ
jgi:hypothetical protein